MAWYISRRGALMKNLAGSVAVAFCVLLVAEARAAGQNKLTQQASGQKTTLPSTQDTSESVSKELEPLLDELQAAANAHDTDRFMAWYSKGEGLVAVFNGEEIRGWDNLYAQQLKWWNHGKSDVVYTQRAAPEIFVLGPDAAVVTLLLDSTRTAADGSTVKNQFAISMVWKKFVQGGWRMVYSHESTVH
jgi:ketosteroid isomerase-like protein